MAVHYEINYFRVFLLVTAIFLFVYIAVFGGDDRHSHRRRGARSAAASSAGSDRHFYRDRRSMSAEGAPPPQARVQRPFQAGPAQVPSCPAVVGVLEFNRRNPSWIPVNAEFYGKAAGDPRGGAGGWFTRPGEFPVIAKTNVSDAAIQEAFTIVNKRVLANLRRDVRIAFHAARTMVVVLGKNDKPGDLPEAQFDVHFPKGLLITTEANLLCTAEDPDDGESVLVGSIGGEVLRALETDSTFTRRITELWLKARARRIYSDNHKANSPRTYWIECVKSYFGANREDLRIHDRKGLRAQDPEMVALLASVFRDDGYTYSCPRVDADGYLHGCRPPSVGPPKDGRSVLKPSAPAVAEVPLTSKGVPSVSPQTQVGSRRSGTDANRQEQPDSGASPAPGAQGPGADEGKPAVEEGHCRPDEIHCAPHDERIYFRCADGQFRSERAPPSTTCREANGVVEFVAGSANPKKL